MELMLVSILAIAISAVNSFHVIIQWMDNKPGDTFTGIAHSFTDYFLYVGQMAQGAAGRWIFSDHLFTNEPLTPTWYYWFNVTLGHIGGWFGLSPFATYNTSLILLVVILCLVWYVLAKTLYPTNRFLRLTTWLMILTTTSWYWNGELLSQFWFSPAPVFNRLGGVPYHVFQSILFLILCMAYTKTSRLVPLVSFLAGLVNPVQTLLFVLASRSIPAAVFGGIGAFLTREEFTRQAVFAAAAQWELAQRVPNTIPVLLLSLGPTLFFVLFGIKRLFQRENQLRTLLVLWGLLSFLFFLSPIPRLFQISPVRFLHPVPYASLAIIGSEGLIALSILLTRSVRKRISLFTIRAFLIALYLVFTVPSISRQLIDRTTPERNPQLLLNTTYNHVPASIVEALDWLKKQHQPGVVLSDPAIPIEVLVPVFTGKPSFSGHPIHTLYPNVKEARRQEFFAGTMPDPARFLSDHRIGYIIAAAHRQLPASASALLVETYRNVALAIYRYSGN